MKKKKALSPAPKKILTTFKVAKKRAKAPDILRPILLLASMMSQAILLLASMMSQAI